MRCRKLTRLKGGSILTFNQAPTFCMHKHIFYFVSFGLRNSENLLMPTSGKERLMVGTLDCETVRKSTTCFLFSLYIKTCAILQLCCIGHFCLFPKSFVCWGRFILFCQRALEKWQNILTEGWKLVPVYLTWEGFKLNLARKRE